MANFFTKLFGTKSQRDLKQLNPILDKCLAAYDEIEKQIGRASCRERV